MQISSFIGTPTEDSVPLTFGSRHIAACLLALPASLPAQVAVGAALGTLMHQNAGDLWHSTTLLDPAFRLDVPSFRVDGDAAFSNEGGRWRGQLGDLDAVAESPVWRGLRLTNDARVETSDVSPGVMRRLGSAESAVSFATARTGGWLGLGVEQSSGVDSAVDRPLIRLGVWHQFQSVTVSLGTAAHSARFGGYPSTTRYVDFTDTLSHGFRTDTVVVPGVPSRATQWADVQARLSWTSTRLALDVTVGMRPKLDDAPAARWGRMTATASLTPRLAAVASIGNEAARPWFGMPASHFVSLGLRVAAPALARPTPTPQLRPSASAFSVRPIDNGMAVVSVRVPDARTVEISGDFNGWKPVALHAVGLDLWEATISVSPGTHHINVRVNGGEWVAPPGLAQISDEFGGTVGLFVVK